MRRPVTVCIPGVMFRCRGGRHGRFPHGVERPKKTMTDHHGYDHQKREERYRWPVVGCARFHIHYSVPANVMFSQDE